MKLVVVQFSVSYYILLLVPDIFLVFCFHTPTVCDLPLM